MSREITELVDLLEDVREYLEGRLGIEEEAEELTEAPMRRAKKEKKKVSAKHPFKNFSSMGPGPGKRTMQKRGRYVCSKRGSDSKRSNTGKKYSYRCTDTETKRKFTVNINRAGKKLSNKKYRRWVRMNKAKLLKGARMAAEKKGAVPSGYDPKTGKLRKLSKAQKKTVNRFIGAQRRKMGLKGGPASLRKATYKRHPK